MPSNLPTPLRKLRAYQTRTMADLMRELKRARKEVRAAIALAAAKAKAASSAKEREELYAEIEEKYRELAEGIDAHIKALSGRAAEAGHKAALVDISPSRAKTTAYDPERTERYFRMIHPSNTKNLAAVFSDQMAEKTVTALRTAVVDVFRRGAVEGLTANEMQKALRDRWDALAGDDNAYRFTDRAGRHWEGARYLQMLVRTTAQRVAIESEIDTFTANGYELAQISRGGDGECPVCAAWEGRIIQMAGKSKRWPTYAEARAAGMFHPNCVHRLLPVDSLVDADEIEQQGRITKPTADQMADPDFMQAQHDQIDEARYMATGLTEEDARRAVTADRLERAIRSGTFSDAAAEAARMLSPEQLDMLRERGIPKFEPARNNERPGTVYRGRILTPRDPDAAAILRVLGLPEGGSGTPQPAPSHEPSPKPKAPPSAFPDNPNDMRVIRALGGSTGAELVEDEHGQQFVRKRGGSAGGDPAEHVRSEAQADMAYRALGVRVPECRLYEIDGKPVKLSKFIPNGTSLDEYLRTASKADCDRVLAEIRADFDVDAVFGNRDVVGMVRDNILIDADGKPWRIDNGSSFGWRATGARKSDWTKWPDEILTMPTADINRGVFDDISLAETVIRSAGRDFAAAIDAVPQQDRAIFKERVKEIQELGHRAKTFQETGYIEAYNSDVILHSYELSKTGFRESVPAQVSAGNFGFFRTAGRAPTTPNGGPGGLPGDWQETIITAAKTINHHAKDSTPPNMAKVSAATALKSKLESLAKQKTKGADYWLGAVKSIEKASKKTGSTVAILNDSINIGDDVSKSQYKSLTDHIHKYITAIGGDTSIVIDWQADQAWDSWHDKSCVRKIVQEWARPMQADTWITNKKNKLGFYKKHQKRFTEDSDFASKAVKTFSAYDAAVQLALENCNFDHRDTKSRSVVLIRTEKEAVLKQHGIAEMNKLMTFPRGACESHSIFKPTYIGGREITLVKVPFPLIKGMYFFERKPNDGRKGCFSRDGENEFACDVRGLPTVYIGDEKAYGLTAYANFENLLSGRR